jgi:hypothetical protein
MVCGNVNQNSVFELRPQYHKLHSQNELCQTLQPPRKITSYFRPAAYISDIQTYVTLTSFVPGYETEVKTVPFCTIFIETALFAFG